MFLKITRWLMNKKIMILEPDTTAGELLVSTAKEVEF